MTRLLVAYGTRYGSTREVAEAVGDTLGAQGLEVTVRPAHDAHSLDGFDGIVLGTPLYLGALHKDVRALLEKQREALAALPLALFALGPIKAGDDLDASRAQLDAALGKLAAGAPATVASAVFVGAYDPARLGLRDKMLTALPASPLHGEPAHDDRDWDAIRAWAAAAGPALAAAAVQSRAAS